MRAIKKYIKQIINIIIYKYVVIFIYMSEL